MFYQSVFLKTFESNFHFLMAQFAHELDICIRASASVRMSVFSLVSDCSIEG